MIKLLDKLKIPITYLALTLIFIINIIAYPFTGISYTLLWSVDKIKDFLIVLLKVKLPKL